MLFDGKFNEFFKIYLKLKLVLDNLQVGGSGIGFTPMMLDFDMIGVTNNLRSLGENDGSDFRYSLFVFRLILWPVTHFYIRLCHAFFL